MAGAVRARAVVTTHRIIAGSTLGDNFPAHERFGPASGDRAQESAGFAGFPPSPNRIQRAPGTGLDREGLWIALGHELMEPLPKCHAVGRIGQKARLSGESEKDFP
jgi:hypothetical protein